MRPPGTLDPSVPASPTPDQASVIEDFIDVFYAPSSVFARREKMGYGVQLLIISVLSAVFAFASRNVIAQISDAEFTRRMTKMMAANPNLPQQAVDMQRSWNEGITMFFSYVGIPVLIFVIGLLVWLAAKLVSAKLTYKQSVLITTIAWIPRLLGSLIGTIQVVVLDTTNMTTWAALTASPARFMDPDTMNSKLIAVMANFDVFSIWYTVLVGIGISVIGKVSRTRGYAAAAGLFILGSIPSLFA